MKSTSFKAHSGKVAKALLAVIILTLTGITACKKDIAAVKSDVTGVTEADAVELTTDAVIPSTGGFTTQATSSIQIYTVAKVSCGDKKDTTITKSSAAGAVPSYNYSLAWSYALACTGIVPTQFTFGFTGNTTYSGTYMTSTDASTGSMILTGILPTAADYMVNTSYERKGTQTSKIGALNSFTSDLVITSTNILIDKITDEIVSGTAKVTITGKTLLGISFSFGGTITFLGDKKATLVLNSGASYPIQWS